MAFGVVILANGQRADDLMGASLVEVHERIDAPTTFYVRYPIYNVDGDLEPLKDPRFAPGEQIAVFQRGTGFNECLVKGEIFSHQIRFVHGVDGSTLEIVGADATIAMDRETKIEQWPSSTTDSDAVSTIVTRYSLVPDVDSTNTRHLEEKRTLIQHDTDLSFVRMLARRNGYLFWVRSDENLIETAYFKPPKMEDPTAPTLKINLDNPTIETFEITWDVERPTSVIAKSWDGSAKSAIDGEGVPPPPTFAGDMPLASIVSASRSTSVIAAVSDAGDLMGRASGVLMETSWFIEARCTVSAAVLGRVVRSHSVVNVDGVGSRYSGSYFVAGVRHMIDDSDHKMELSLIRNGWKP